MRGLAAVLITCMVAAGLAIALMLRGPSWAWWTNPAALAALVATVGLVAMILVPRSWWRA